MDTAALSLTQAPQAMALFRDETQTPEARACARDYLILLAVIDELERQQIESTVALARASVALGIDDNG